MTQNFRIVLLAMIAWLCMDMQAGIAYAGKEPVDSKELERINREMLEKKKELTRASKKEKSILSELDKIDRDIQTGSSQLGNHQKQLKQAETALREAEASYIETSRKLSTLQDIYGRRLRALYKMTRTGNAVFSTENLGSAFKHVKYMQVIAEYDHKIVREYSETLERLEKRQAEMAQRKSDILSQKQTVQLKTVELTTQKQKKNEILASVRKEKRLYEQSLRELEEASASLWAMIKRAEEKKKTKTAAQKSVAPSGDSRGGKNLPWPVEGNILTHFGMQKHPKFGTMVFRRGIEIQSRIGETIRAVSEGQVAYADWFKGHGKLIIVDHGSGLYTLYGNLSRLDIQKGDKVTRGQVIGLTGDTGSLKGAKLYFEVRQNGEAQDPLLWLAKK